MNTPVIHEFRGDMAFLSNFYPSPFMEWGYVWETVEHAFQAAKAKDDVQFHVIRQATSPALAKKLGRSCIMRPTWNNEKLDIMRKLLFLKFHSNPLLKEKLLATGKMVLEEGNWWGDCFWGISPAGSGNGKNHLGIMLMEVRAHYLIQQINFTR